MKTKSKLSAIQPIRAMINTLFLRVNARIADAPVGATA
jgi:hypothetical protein